MIKPFYEDVVIAGFGGQGLMFIGKLLAYSAMKEGRHVTWIPSYGVEMRGGTANCTVVISSEPIGSPVIKHPQSAIIMNQPSFDIFLSKVRQDGILVINSSLIKYQEEREDIKIIKIPANEIALKLGNDRVANMVMLGAYTFFRKVVSDNSILKGLKYILGNGKEDIININRNAFKEGKKLAVDY